MPTVIYDFDGTIVDSLELYIKAYKKALKYFDIKLSDDQIVEKCFNQFDSTIAHTFSIDAVDFSHQYRMAIKKLNSGLKLFPGARKTLKLLGEKAKLGLASMAPQQYLRHQAHILHMYKHFNMVKGNTHPPKKRSDLFEDILLRLPSDKVYVVGDSMSDMEAADRIGAHKILFHPRVNEKYYKLDELMKGQPDHVIKNHTDILKII